jgi:photosystem II stability/assembly factor-like uncharacterized protein
MKRIIAICVVLTLGICLLLMTDASDSLFSSLSITSDPEMAQKYPKPPGKRPSDWFYIQRAYPNGIVSTEKQRQAISYAKVSRRAAIDRASSSRSTSAIAQSNWVQAGPTNIPGRISDIAVHPSDLATVYAASSAGGIFKSTDSGHTWTTTFNDEGSLAMGAVAIHPDNPNILYAGTGDPNVGFDSYLGIGIFKSTDAGATWQHMGLDSSFHIARIIIDPLRPETVFVAAGGRHFTKTSVGGNAERGVYRSTDGGANWSKMLFVSDSTACIDLAYEPQNTTVYAAMWERIRYVDEPTRLGGITSGVYRSFNSGDTWEDLAITGIGLPAHDDTVGRIGVTAVPNTETVYAMYSNSEGVFMGLYLSNTSGFQWLRVNDNTLVNAPLNASWQGGWYFGRVYAAPSDPEIVYATGLEIWRGTFGGAFWEWASDGIHVDQHAMWINPNDPSFIYSGCDGGVNISYDAGNTWTVRVNQPSTQFYAVTIDPSNPERLYGGTQDNGTLRTLTGNLDDWERIWGGDGFYCLVDPTDPDRIYAESQWGWLVYSTNGGLNWSFGRNGMDYNNERHGWSTPVVMDPNANMTLYYGSNFLYKTTDGAANWTINSPDMTNGPHPRSSHGTISTIAVAPSNSSVIYLGTNDGNVWVTQNGGSTNPADWTLISATLPDRWITRVAVDPHHENIAYATVSGYWSGEAQPHIYRTEDFGANWTGISGDLPDAPINDVIPDPADSSILVIGTDYGVYLTEDLGSTWTPLGTGLPIIPVHDLAFHEPTRKLVAGTHGQSMFSTTFACCADRTGNVDMVGDFPTEVDLSDLGLLVDFIFEEPGTVTLPCLGEADVDALGGANPIDLSDLGLLVDFVFLDPGTVFLPSCQ